MRLVTQGGAFNLTRLLDGNADMQLAAKSNTLNTTSLFIGHTAISLATKSGTLNTTSLFIGHAATTLTTQGDIIRRRNIGVEFSHFEFASTKPFNRLGFNRRHTAKRAIYRGSGTKMALSATTTAHNVTISRGFKGASYMALAAILSTLNTISTFAGDVDMALQACGYINASRGFDGSSYMALTAAALSLTRTRNIDGHAPMLLTASGTGFNLFVLTTLELTTLTLARSDVLVIDTDEKTITLNGVNAMRHLSRNSDFFNFAPGINEVLYQSSNASAEVEMRILWRDAWL